MATIETDGRLAINLGVAQDVVAVELVSIPGAERQRAGLCLKG